MNPLSATCWAVLLAGACALALGGCAGRPPRRAVDPAAPGASSAPAMTTETTDLADCDRWVPGGAPVSIDAYVRYQGDGRPRYAFVHDATMRSVQALRCFSEALLHSSVDAEGSADMLVPVALRCAPPAPFAVGSVCEVMPWTGDYARPLDAALGQATLAFAAEASPVDRGWAALDLLDPAAAALLLEPALEAQPQDERARRGLAIARAESCSPKPAAELLAFAGDGRAEPGPLHEARLRVCLARGDDRCAAREFEQARKEVGAGPRSFELSQAQEAARDAVLRLEQRDWIEAAGKASGAKLPRGGADGECFGVGRGAPLAGQRRSIDGPAGRLRVDAGGPEHGVPVLLVHGLGGSLGVWEETLTRLRRSRRAAALDLRGHGGSEAPRDAAYAADALADDVRAAADALGLSRVALVGHALGGTVAARFAARWPERVAALVLVDPLGDLSRAPPASQAKLQQIEERTVVALLDAFDQTLLREATLQTKARVLVQLHQTPPAALAACLHALVAANPAADLAAFPGPRTVLATAYDDEPFALHRLVQGLEVKRLARSSHWPMLDLPDALPAALERLLAPLDGAADAQSAAREAQR